MNYFHTDEPRMIQWLADVFTTAAAEGRKVRLRTNARNELLVKVGEGVWTAPFSSTPDPYRSAPAWDN